jgi:O-antigen/teichoic acid export membrane protein
VLLGSQWQHAVPIIQILAFAGALTALISNNVSAYLALGRPHLATLIFVARVVTFLAAIALLGTSRGFTAVAHAELLATLCSLLVSLPILFGALKLRVRDYLAILWRPLLASAAAYEVVRQLLMQIGTEGAFGEAVLQLIAGTLAGAAVYGGGLWLLWAAAGRPATVEQMIARRAIDALSSRRSRSA